MDAVSLLVERGADIESTTGDGKSTLIIASERGCLDLVHWLVAAGANVNKTDKVCGPNLGKNINRFFSRRMALPLSVGLARTVILTLLGS